MNEINPLYLIPVKDRKRLRNELIRKLWANGEGHSMDAICAMSRKNPEMFYGTSGLSKTTVFFAINGRPKKKVGNKNKNNSRNSN